MKYKVIFSPEAEEQLAELFRYIGAVASPGIAERYVNAVITYCESLHTFPLHGAKRDDIRPGLRITNYKGRTAVAFAIDNQQVSVIGVFYGGQDCETALREDLGEES